MDKIEIANGDRINQLVDHLNINPKSCLDLGCRSGYLLQQLQVYNWCKIMGVEDQQTPEISEYVEDIADVEGKFDLISCIRRPEYIEVDWMAEHLNDGGTILFEIMSEDEQAEIETELDDLEIPYMTIEQEPVRIIFAGERYANSKMDKVYYSFESPDFDEREEYIKWLGKQYGKEVDL